MKIAGRVLKFYSGIITECLPLFVAAGIFMVFTSVTGRFQGSYLLRLPEVINVLVIPVFMGYLAGKKCGQDAGGLAGILAASVLVITGERVSLAAAVMAGGGSGFLYRKGMEKLEKRIPAGCMMLVNNLYLALTGIAVGGLACHFLIPAFLTVGNAMGRGTSWAMREWLVPLAGAVIEPLKILFLNNWINHGFLVPFGMAQVQAAGSSVLFLMETNPGPGAGILMAYAIMRRQKRRTAFSGLAIQVLGGIHEIYFPYVLSHPILLLAAIAGNIAGNYCFLLLDSGIMGVVSPGSVITILLMAAPGKWPGLIVGMTVSAAVSCLISCLILAGERDRKAEETVLVKQGEKMEHIYFVCDAGMGSSAMASALFKRKIKAEGIEGIQISHTAADSIPDDADAVVCQKNFAACLPDIKVRLFTVQNLTDMAEYEELIGLLRGGR